MVVNKGVAVQGSALVNTSQARASARRVQDWGTSVRGAMQAGGVLLPSPSLRGSPLCGLKRW